jgi:2-polyprenyl-6-methoxyphenol hydroxylase-like FAD-dependent oxidoreductase
MPRTYRVAVVGCGVAGAATAGLLAADGHAVVVLEQSPALGAAGAGILLQPSGQAVLAHMGLLDEVLARAAPIDALDARHPCGRTMICNTYTDYESGFRAYGVHRGVMFNTLLRRLQSTPAEVRLGCEIVARQVRPEGVTLVDTHGQPHGPFDLVIAADGARSRLRAVCRLPARMVAYPHGTLWLIAPSTFAERKLLQVVRGTHQLFGLLPLGDGLATLYWGLPLRDFAALRDRGLAALKAEILAFAPEAEETLGFLYDFDQLILTSYRHIWMPRIHDRTTIFIGDAAHAMSPHLGQGMNLALLDAWRLAAQLRHADTPHAAFTNFRAEQRTHLRYYQFVTFALSPFFQSDWPILGWGRDRVLPWLPRIPWVKRQMLLTVGGLKGGFLRGRLPVSAARV